MVRRESLSPEAQRLAEMYEAKARSELAKADQGVPGTGEVQAAGDPFARVLLVKGEPGPADLAAGRALAGPDGEAAAKVLAALGFDPGSVMSIIARPGSRASAETVRRLRVYVEVVDPRVVVALDEIAAEDLGDSLGVRLEPGRPRTASGRVVLAVEGLEASLGDEARKRRVWNQFQSLKGQVR